MHTFFEIVQELRWFMVLNFTVLYGSTAELIVQLHRKNCSRASFILCSLWTKPEMNVPREFRFCIAVCLNEKVDSILFGCFGIQLFLSQINLRSTRYMSHQWRISHGLTLALELVRVSENNSNDKIFEYSSVMEAFVIENFLLQFAKFQARQFFQHFRKPDE